MSFDRLPLAKKLIVHRGIEKLVLEIETCRAALALGERVPLFDR